MGARGGKEQQDQSYIKNGIAIYELPNGDKY